MNFTYFKFLFLTTIKKRPVWITWLLFLFTCTAFLIILPAVARMNTLQVWANTTMAVCQTFLGMTAALFTAILGIHIFKDGNEEGTELIVISKPISRIKIILTKFIVFGVFCLLVNITSLIITAFTIFLPTTEHKFYWKLIVSMFIGNLITFGVFGSIAILLTVKFAKAGVIVANVMISLIFLIYQALTLFCFSIPSKSLVDHGMTTPSYILQDRDLTTGKYKETEVVKFNTTAANAALDVGQRNTSIDWKDTANYWNLEILKNNPSNILNATDWAGQVSLTYFSVGIDEYAYRQGHRFFAISRFYDYQLTSPASPEIIGGLDLENKQTLPWLYLGDTYLDLGESEELGLFLYYPSSYGFAGIAPIGTTRLRGYEDKIPVGMYVKTGELLASKDVYFEADEWVKYYDGFKAMYDTIFNYKYYDKYFYPSVTPYIDYPTAWCSSNASLTHYYDLVWSCLTGNSTKEEYLGEDSPLKNYDRKYFDINSQSDLNERFIQFKYFAYQMALIEQQNVLNNAPNDQYEKEAKQLALDSIKTKAFENLFGIKHFENNWMMQSDKEADFSFIEPNTQTVAYTLLHETADELDDLVPTEEKESVLTNCSLAKMNRTSSIYKYCCYPKEEFLFTSIDNPNRSAEYNGKTYFVSNEWIPYINTILQSYMNRPEGQNMQWFFYTSTETRHFYVYAIVWGCIAMLMFSAGALVYNKYDVK